jgi:hypothetical protein
MLAPTLAPTLAQLQRDFMAHLLAPAGTTNRFVIRDAIIDDRNENGISAETRLHVYHYGYRARLLEVMQDVFERTWAYLGDDGFERAARDYIEATPSNGKTLNRFGEHFSAWLVSQYADDGEIAEIARIDWMMRCAFDGADAVPIGTTHLTQITAEDWAVVGFAFHPTLTLAPFHYNAASMWEALERGEAPPAAAPLSAETSIVVWRRDVRPHFRTIDQMEAAAIQQMRAGASFAAMCEAMSAAFPVEDIARLAGQWLRRWLDDEMLCAVLLPSELSTPSQTAS